MVVMNGYFPQGESRDHPVKFPAKEKFYADLQALLVNHYRADQAQLDADDDLGNGQIAMGG